MTRDPSQFSDGPRGSDRDASYDVSGTVIRSNCSSSMQTRESSFAGNQSFPDKHRMLANMNSQRCKNCSLNHSLKRTIVVEHSDGERGGFGGDGNNRGHCGHRSHHAMDIVRLPELVQATSLTQQ